MAARASCAWRLTVAAEIGTEIGDRAGALWLADLAAEDLPLEVLGWAGGG